MKNAINQIAAKIVAGKAVVFTGAVYFDAFMSDKEARIKYWQQKMAMYDDLQKAKPNAAHSALAELYRHGHLSAVITQNIDGLHQEAGIATDDVIELHGSIRRVRCMSCNAISSDHDAFARVKAGDLTPECHCGGRNATAAVI